MEWLTLLVLLFITVGYLCIGAAVFQALESDNEQEVKTNTNVDIERFLTNFTCVSKQQLQTLIRTIISAYDSGVLYSPDSDTSDNWNYHNSFFFSTTVVTTIGYGHVSPSTTGGQIFCIFYAVLGIPVVGVFLSGIGNKCHKPFKAFKDRSKNKFVRIVKSFLIGLFGFLVLVLLPAIAFHRAEGWNYFESLYYGVITLTTIGFGDFVAGQEDKDYEVAYRLLLCLWIFLGLAWVAVVLTDVGDFLSEKVNEREKKKEAYRAKNQNGKEEFNSSTSTAHTEISTNL